MRLRRTWTIAAALAAAIPFAPAQAGTVTARVNAKVVKPLVITHVQDLDLGTVLIPSGSWAGSSLDLSRYGILTCPAPLLCSGVTQVAIYNVRGSSGSTVRISAPDVLMVNQNDPTDTLTLTVDSPGTVYLTNSGARGTNFELGGSIALSPATADGTYEGTFNVTVDY